MHSRATVAEALRLRDEEGFGAVRVARRLGLSVGTVRDWHAGKLPRHSRTTLRNGDPLPPACLVCGQDKHRFAELPRAYVHLLGLYLGDGTISRHRRGV
ncbi:MAG: helix-turn-helix domain-containing protein [Solirubrobacterales bacterium]